MYLSSDTHKIFKKKKNRHVFKPQHLSHTTGMLSIRFIVYGFRSGLLCCRTFTHLKNRNRFSEFPGVYVTAILSFHCSTFLFLKFFHQQNWRRLLIARRDGNLKLKILPTIERDNCFKAL